MPNRPGDTAARTETEMRVDFHSALDELNDRFVATGLRVAEELPVLTEKFLQGDRTAIDEARALSIEIGNECRAIEDESFVILARESPVSGDLRRLVAIMRTVADVERSASLLKHVCESLTRFDPRFLPAQARAQVSELATRSTKVFAGGLDAWRRRDAHAVSDIDDEDEAVDQLQAMLLDEAASLDEPGDEMLILGLIARYYERIADHGVAIAQDAAFVATGRRTRVGKRRRESDEDAG